ncbi:hypothetical protein I7I53_06431 [Histoplasma capsulatum var. duboisii H88]|uniref:Uncharacterized protein n=1 Tax=Ajellomyces capsulatus (strain H88) TaxID=544711 RepID=A0A8A1L9T4_AJEC8|nr:hypothetical protein I7I53_06431 [Histoplasma capsulatum var. duboisii H88]
MRVRIINLARTGLPRMSTTRGAHIAVILISHLLCVEDFQMPFSPWLPLSQLILFYNIHDDIEGLFQTTVLVNDGSIHHAGDVI